MNLYKFFAVVVCSCSLITSSVAQYNTGWKMQPTTIKTRWAEHVLPENSLPEYPRPQMVRNKWTNLNGLWSYAVTAKEANMPSRYDNKILVPFPIESALSGVKKGLQPDQMLWYNRTLTKPSMKLTDKVLLHFGAVDYEATVYINNKQIGKHTGGYQSFSLDVTDILKNGKNDLTVKVWDPTDEGPNPHGKQSLNPGAIMYTPSSGIWQTVWMEVVPEVSIKSLKITPNVDGEELNLNVIVSSVIPAHLGVTIEGIVIDGGKEIYRKVQDNVTKSMVLKVRNAKLWSPDDPFLYDMVVRLKKNGKVVDEVRSYFGMRKIEVKKDRKGIERIFLNNKYTYNLGTLDQGYWPDGLYTAPTDAALKFDIQAAKAMGFNTIRKHIKIEPARWYYHCDKLGMLVWQDMVNPGNATNEAREQFEKENAENLSQLHNYPSITTWVLFNEGWGAYDQARLTKWMKNADPSRLVNGHSGENYFDGDFMMSKTKTWQTSENSDMSDIHTYPLPALPTYIAGKVRVLGEFGGIGVSIENHLWDDITSGWGYGDTVDPLIMRRQYSIMVDSLKKFEELGLTASVYTQPFDVESEQNGLMTYDRELIKTPVASLRKINAKLWPVTKNHAFVTKEFAPTVADSVIKDYQERLSAYASGKKDSIFLRCLAIMAYAQKDATNAARISSEYIEQLKAPFTEPNLKFIRKLTSTSKEPGFNLMLKNLDKIAPVMDAKLFKMRIQEIIFKEEVKPLLTENPDWQSVDNVILKYPEIDGELINGLAVINYLNAKTKDKVIYANNVVDAATRYDSVYNDGAYGTWAWVLFKASTNTSQLIKALEWAKKELDRTPKGNDDYAGKIDTYANLLYKLGRKEKALEWQAKATEAAPNDEKINSAYDKMRKGISTWSDK